jgi:hypothetical protein
MRDIYLKSHDSVALQGTCSAIKALEVPDAATGSAQDALIQPDTYDGHQAFVTGFHTGRCNQSCRDKFFKNFWRDHMSSRC